jgi:hypothetical protein
LTGSEASDVFSVGRVERASHFTQDNATASRTQRVTLVKFNYDENPQSFAIKAHTVTADEVGPGLTARVDLVASQVGASPFCSLLTAGHAQGEAYVNCIVTVRP